MNNLEAFPSGPGYEFSPSRGMTLRDYFAAKAMAAHIASVQSFFSEEGRETGAFAAYQWADAMLKRREA